MKKSLECIGAMAVAALLALSPISGAFAQTVPNSAAAATAPSPSPSLVKALQEALSKQGQTVEANGVFDDATRNALRRFQTQHHLPVTGEADQATLAKLGITGQSVSSTSTTGQASTPSPQASTREPGAGMSGMMSGPMMQGMMQTMRGMMGMMDSEMQSRQMGTGSMRDCPMMSGGQMSGPAMMQMMQGMMQMMRAMQNQMQPDQKSRDSQ